jgi:phage tail P2-like protein
MTGLVPSNHRPIEHALAQVLEPLSAIDPAGINVVWDAWRCPSPLLPFLAWALSVDLWDDGWDEVTQRAAIAASPEYHRRKGTSASVDAALATLGRGAYTIDWHATTPEGRRGTFAVRIPLLDQDTAQDMAEMLTRARRVVSLAKPKSRAFAVAFSRDVAGAITVSAGIGVAETVSLVAPSDTIDISLAMSAGIAADETVTLWS